MPAHRFVFLDGLRGIAALAVVLLHLSAGNQNVPQIVRHAGLAVDFFFILSGFVIAFAYDDRLRDGRLDFWSFMRARMIRLYPMLLLGLALGATVFFIRIMTRHEWELVGPFIGALVMGILMLPSHLIVGDGYASAYPLNVPSWSLFFEIAANGVYAIVARRVTNLRLILVTCIGAAGLFISMVGRGQVTGGQEWATFALGTWRILFAFSAGLLIFRLRGRLPTLPPLLAIAVALTFVASLVAPLPTSWLYDGVCVFVVFPTVIILGAGIRMAGASARLCLFVGRLSYPLYLIHYPAVRIGGVILKAHPLYGLRLTAFLALIFVLIIGASIACLIFIDEPVRRALAQRFKRFPLPMAVKAG